MLKMKVSSVIRCCALIFGLLLNGASSQNLEKEAVEFGKFN